MSEQESQIGFSDSVGEKEIRVRQAELSIRKGAGELDARDFSAADIFHLQKDEGDRPVERTDLESRSAPRALVVSNSEFHAIGYIDVVLPDGDTLTLFANDFSSGSEDPKGPLILFPEDLGNLTKER